MTWGRGDMVLPVNEITGRRLVLYRIFLYNFLLLLLCFLLSYYITGVRASCIDPQQRRSWDSEESSKVLILETGHDNPVVLSLRPGRIKVTGKTIEQWYGFANEIDDGKGEKEATSNCRPVRPPFRIGLEVFRGGHQWMIFVLLSLVLGSYLWVYK